MRMKSEQPSPIYLILENGMVFEGQSFGARGEVTGELVFTTAMTGYLETLTDPSYYGQIVLQTFPLIGNYGVIPSDFESGSPRLTAYIVRQWCQDPSNFRSEGDLDAFFKARNIIGLCGIDTRRLAKIIRERGVMNARIVTELPRDLERVAGDISEYRVRDAVSAVSCQKPEVLTPENPARKIVLWDFGAKRNIARELCRRGSEVVIVPASTTAKEILAMEPDGLMLSNGPGDPLENTAIIAELTKLCNAEYRGGKLPIFGICLGHQLLALARGARTGKLHYGHRGANQPVRERSTGRVFITSQNHGYEVLAGTLPPSAEESFVNANDGTNEGVSYRDIPAFSVQFHPEACGGPQDTRFLFDRFLAMADEENGRRGA